MIRLRWWAPAACVLGLSWVPAAIADPPRNPAPPASPAPAGPAPASPADVGRRLEVMRMWGLSRELDLSDDELAKLLPVMNHHAHERESLRKEQRAAIEALTQLVQHPAPGRAEASDDDIRGATERTIDLEQRLVENRRKEFEDVAKVLPPKRAAQYMLFHVKFAKRMKDLAESGWRQRSGRTAEGTVERRAPGAAEPPAVESPQGAPAPDSRPESKPAPDGGTIDD